MAFRKKADSILEFTPDILVIQECKNLERLNFKNNKRIPNYSVWLGKNSIKRVGIFSFCDYQFEVLLGFYTLKPIN